MWKTKIPSKIHHFLWRLLSRSLATGNNLRRRHITRDVMCKKMLSKRGNRVPSFL
ncbi:unnamed protein product [Brassica oleracea var. botrytis]